MSTEARVATLEAKHEALDDACRERNKVIEATHDVVTLALKEQREKFAVLEYRLEKLEAANRGNRDSFRQLELLLRQLLPHTN
ncbi:hypothetical protein [Sansalvadorimonas verongulae]|uniref:hypothetical protein n=1 Tax=Sansalvadorimonas verongulae TaxID=2172824 RepID=UPI0012BD0C09|nr:hypothetical protein [Sansalvadorimonas verongulae]MTI12471.1 hypothetical protein [Sansalvadorimonas verongulae]